MASHLDSVECIDNGADSFGHLRERRNLSAQARVLARHARLDHIARGLVVVGSDIHRHQRVGTGVVAASLGPRGGGVEGGLHILDAPREDSQNLKAHKHPSALHQQPIRGSLLLTRFLAMMLSACSSGESSGALSPLAWTPAMCREMRSVAWMMSRTVCMVRDISNKTIDQKYQDGAKYQGMMTRSQDGSCTAQQSLA